MVDNERSESRTLRFKIFETTVPKSTASYSRIFKISDIFFYHYTSYSLEQAVSHFNHYYSPKRRWSSPRTCSEGIEGRWRYGSAQSYPRRYVGEKGSRSLPAQLTTGRGSTSVFSRRMGVARARLDLQKTKYLPIRSRTTERPAKSRRQNSNFKKHLPGVHLQQFEELQMASLQFNLQCYIWVGSGGHWNGPPWRLTSLGYM